MPIFDPNSNSNIIPNDNFTLFSIVSISTGSVLFGMVKQKPFVLGNAISVAQTSVKNIPTDGKVEMRKRRKEIEKEKQWPNSKYLKWSMFSGRFYRKPHKI